MAEVHDCFTPTEMILMEDLVEVVEMDIPLVVRLVVLLVLMVMLVEKVNMLPLDLNTKVAVAVVPEPLVKLVLKVV